MSLLPLYGARTAGGTARFVLRPSRQSGCWQGSIEEPFHANSLLISPQKSAFAGRVGCHLLNSLFGSLYQPTLTNYVTCHNRYLPHYTNPPSQIGLIITCHSRRLFHLIHPLSPIGLIVTSYDRQFFHNCHSRDLLTPLAIVDGFTIVS